MRVVKAELITEKIKELCVKANTCLPNDVLMSLKNAYETEKNKKAKKILSILLENANIAKKEAIPLCQDTGMVIVYCALGQDVHVKGDLSKAIQEGVKTAYKDAYLRKSVVKDPFERVNTNTNTPAIIYYSIVKGNKVKMTVTPKGFGSENKSLTRMFLPTHSMNDVENYVVESLQTIGSDACPPYIVGVGIGGTLDKAVLLSKKAVLNPVNKSNSKTHLADLEKRLLRKINALKIGVMGLGGNTTALAVKILTYPTHIAGLPVAINISCHATRRASTII